MNLVFSVQSVACPVLQVKPDDARINHEERAQENEFNERKRKQKGHVDIEQLQRNRWRDRQHGCQKKRDRHGPEVKPRLWTKVMATVVAPAVDSKNVMQDGPLVASGAARLENGAQLKAGAVGLSILIVFHKGAF